jgi:predicted peptidase
MVGLIRWHLVVLLSVCVALTGVLDLAADEQAARPRQAAERIEKTVEVTYALEYLVALPKGYDADKDKHWPVVLFLHGGGERGDDLSKVRKWGPPAMIDKGHEFEAIVVSPQCPADSWWEAQTHALFLLLDQIESRYRVDKDRIYVTGLSMGGYATWAMAGQAPDRFAAAVPICGGGTRWQGMRVGRAKLPIWIFHGDEDKAVPVDEAHQMLKHLERAGHDEAKVTIYPGVGHNSWSATYADEAMWTWLFEQRRNKPEAKE